MPCRLVNIAYILNMTSASTSQTQLITNRQCVTHHKPLVFSSFYTISWLKHENRRTSKTITYIYHRMSVNYSLHRTDSMYGVQQQSAFRHWLKCAVFALNCTAFITAAQWYTDSEALLKLIKPTLWPAISQLVNLCSNEVGRIHCTLPYRKQDNVAFDTQMILSVFFMSCGERQKKKKACGRDESEKTFGFLIQTDRQTDTATGLFPPLTTETNTKGSYILGTSPSQDWSDR